MTANLGAVGPCRVCTIVSCCPICPWAGFQLNVFFARVLGSRLGDYYFLVRRISRSGRSVLSGGLEAVGVVPENIKFRSI
jgi:hypothetical protein